MWTIEKLCCRHLSGSTISISLDVSASPVSYSTLCLTSAGLWEAPLTIAGLSSGFWAPPAQRSAPPPLIGLCCSVSCWSRSKEHQQEPLWFQRACGAAETGWSCWKAVDGRKQEHQTLYCRYFHPAQNIKQRIGSKRSSEEGLLVLWHTGLEASWTLSLSTFLPHSDLNNNC